MLLFARATCTKPETFSGSHSSAIQCLCWGGLVCPSACAWGCWDISLCLSLDFNGYASREEAESELSESQGHPEDILWPLCILNRWLGAGSEMRCPQRRRLQPVGMSGAKTGPQTSVFPAAFPIPLAGKGLRRAWGGTEIFLNTLLSQSPLFNR